jgi:hypothetical protein
VQHRTIKSQDYDYRAWPADVVAHFHFPLQFPFLAPELRLKSDYQPAPSTVQPNVNGPLLPLNTLAPDDTRERDDDDERRRLPTT